MIWYIRYHPGQVTWHVSGVGILYRPRITLSQVLIGCVPGRDVNWMITATTSPMLNKTLRHHLLLLDGHITPSWRGLVFEGGPLLKPSRAPKPSQRTRSELLPYSRNECHVPFDPPLYVRLWVPVVEVRPPNSSQNHHCLYFSPCLRVEFSNGRSEGGLQNATRVIRLGMSRSLGRQILPRRSVVFVPTQTSPPFQRSSGPASHFPVAQSRSQYVSL